MAGGQIFTAPGAKRLAQFYEQTRSPYTVYFDHDKVGHRLYCWYGQSYQTPYSLRHLAHVDMVVADPQTRAVHQIVEVEDSSSRPKTLIADVMAVLLGDGMAFDGSHDWRIGPWTSLIVLAYHASPPTPEYLARIQHIEQRLNGLLPHLDTGNARLGKIELSLFADLDGLTRYLQARGQSAHA